MPLYTVFCQKCGTEIEIYCPVAERNNHRCDKCGGNMKVLITQSMGAFLPSTLRIKERHKKWRKERGLYP